MSVKLTQYQTEKGECLMNKIDNSTIKVGDIVWIKEISGSWFRDSITKINSGVVRKVTSSRIYVDVTYPSGNETLTKILAFEYRKTKRLVYRDSMDMSIYYLYKSEREIKEVENNIKAKKDAISELEATLKNKLNTLNTEQIESITKFIKSLK